MMYPNITVRSRVSGFDVPSFSVEACHDNEGDWETWFNGTEVELGVAAINNLLNQYPDYDLYIEDTHVPIKGYVFQIRTDNNVKKFFRGVDSVKNPFYNRKVYENATEGSTVSFTAINL